MDKMNTHKKKVSKKWFHLKTSIQGLDNFETLTPRFTLFTSKKGPSILQELEARDKPSFEDLLQAAKDLEKVLLAFPSLEDHLADVERLIERMENELEAYSNG